MTVLDFEHKSDAMRLMHPAFSKLWIVTELVIHETGVRVICIGKKDEICTALDLMGCTNWCTID